MERLPNMSPSLNSKSESGRGAGEKQDGKMVYLSAGISERERGHEGCRVCPRRSSLERGVEHIECHVCVCVSE